MRASPPGGRSTRRGNRVWSQEGGRPGWSCLYLASVFITDNYRVLFLWFPRKMFQKSICKLPLPHINFSELLNQDFVIFGGTSLIGSSVGVVLNHFFASVGMWRACKIKGKRHAGKPRASEVEEGNKSTSEWGFFTTFLSWQADSHQQHDRSSTTLALLRLPSRCVQTQVWVLLAVHLVSWSMSSFPLVTF